MNLEIIIPKDIKKLKSTIQALEYLIKNDKNDLDREIHTQALKAYKKAYEERI